MNVEDPFVQLGKAGLPLDSLFVMDSHCHLGPCRRLRVIDGSIESLVRTMDGLGVDVAAPSSMLACMEGYVEQGNDQVIDAVQRYPDRILGYMAVNPKYPKAADREMQRCLEAGLRAIKVHTGLGTAYDEPCYTLVWEFAAANGLPVLAHTWGKELDQLEPLFRRYVGLTWILAHGGCVERERYLRVGVEYPNVWVDTAYSACPRGLIEYLVLNGLEDKLLWGTDTAFMSAAPQLGRVLFAQITTTQKEKVLGQNARHAFRLR
jgi:predicted TIM-barrel fold metal-dependent hydrolase